MSGNQNSHLKNPTGFGDLQSLVPQAFAVVVRALNDPDLDVRREAVAAVGDAAWQQLLGFILR